MKIEQILIQPIGQRLNPGTLTIKTRKKKWQVGEVWWQQIILMDETGEIPADVKIGKKYLPLDGNSKISIIVAEVQEAEYLGKDRPKLVVDQYVIPTTSMAEYEQNQDEMEDELRFIIKGKIRHGLVCSLIQSKEIALETIEEKSKKLINFMVDFIMTGE